VCSGHPALRDLEVRQALAKATDKQQIIDVATLGTAAQGLTIVTNGLGAFYLGTDSDYTFDVDAANQQLDAAGYADTNGDGIRECLPEQDCDDLTFRFSYPDDIDTAPREAELLDAMWGEVGVDLVITSLDADTLTSICCPAFDYDVILWSWGSDPDPQFLLGVALCENIDNGFSESGYCNPEYDELYAQQAVETDPDTRVDIVHQMQEILIRDLPYIVPYYPSSVEAYRTDAFAGWHEGETGWGLDDISSLGFIYQVQ
jgi:peptide/nickel transport system substrate-binding protein